MRPQAMLEAKDLPKCDLSNYLSERLDNVLENDRRVRAERDGCPIEHVSPLLQRETYGKKVRVTQWQST